MAGPINIGKVSAIHKSFVIAHAAMVDRILNETGNTAQRRVKTTGAFQRRSSSSAKDATKFKVVKTGGGRILRIRNTKRHAKFLEFGTAPHPIVAKNAKVLRFKVGGAVIFRRRVMHPGTKATRFLWRESSAAFRQAAPRLRAGMARVAKRF